MHDVHTCSRCGEPFTTARTFWMFGFQRRFVRRCEWLMPHAEVRTLTAHLAYRRHDCSNLVFEDSGLAAALQAALEKPEHDSSRVVSAPCPA